MLSDESIYMYVRTYVRTYVHTYIHIYIYIHTHTDIEVQAVSQNIYAETQVE